MSRVRDTVLASLAAIGARSEAAFYADRFAELEPERFAFFAIDPRALQGSLLEAFISNVKLLADLELTPVIVLGVLDEEQTHVRFQSQKLVKELTDAGVGCVRLNTATYGLISEVRKTCSGGRIPILEITDTRNRLGITDLVEKLRPDKVIFLQPSGGLTQSGRRIGVINIDSDTTEDYVQSIGQSQFVDLVRQLLREVDSETHYILASPLNLIAELFTESGSGTLIRRGAQLKEVKTYRTLDPDLLEHSLESAFGRTLDPRFLKRSPKRVIIERDYRGGAIVHELDGLPYLSKFWVRREARGEGLGRDLWNALTAEQSSLVWRSRRSNPFNGWYTARCDGFHRQGDWTVFWIGMEAGALPHAIATVLGQGDDFGEALTSLAAE